MLISGIGSYANVDLPIEEIRSVKAATAPTPNTPYFQGRNPDNTFSSFYNQALRDQHKDEMLATRKLRELRVSEDYKMLQEQQRRSKVAHIVDTYR